MRRSTGQLVLGCGAVLALHAADAAAQRPSAWAVSSRPVVEIGVVDGDPAYMFTAVRAARLLPGGRIVVADRGTPSVRVYDSGGTIQSAFGRAGDGPGEFRGIGGLAVHPPDTIRVWDPATFRISTFLADGSLVGTQRYDPHQPGGPNSGLDGFAGYFGNGDVALSWTVARRPVQGEVSADRTVYAAVFRDSVFFMNGAAGRVEVLHPSGEGLARTIVVAAPHIDASNAWAALRRKILDIGRESLPERIPATRLAHTPALAGMLFDDRGLIWLKVYDPTSDSVYLGRPPGPGGVWLVITPEGDAVAEVTIPNSVIPMQIVGDRLIGVTRGELDVERVVIHAIAR